MAESTSSALVGIFVGGAARRMGGYPKGSLPAPDTGEALVVRLARLSAELGARAVWVGDAAAYRALVPGLSEVCDEPVGAGPLGGLQALLRAAGERPVLALACDMPHVSRALLERLLTEQPQATALAPRSQSGLWEPLCARYDALRVAPACAATLAQGQRSLQALLAKLEVAELALSPAERRQLRDWDAPEDVDR